MLAPSASTRKAKTSISSPRSEAVPPRLLGYTARVKGKTPTILFSLLAAFVTLSTITNVMPDNADVIALAERTVCQGKTPCRYAKTSVMRTPLGQTFAFTDGKTNVEVTCRRGAIAFGDYACKTSQSP